MLRSVSWVVAALLATAPAAVAQSDGSSSAAARPAREIGLPSGYAGPPLPAAPATISRDASGGVTIRAVRLTAPLRIDGALDEPFYREVQPASDFVQIEPRDGQPAVDQTEVWLSFDDDTVYFSVNALDSDMGHLVANEMRRDSNNIFMANDFIAFLFDTFYDRRNALYLSFNALGARQEGQLTNERNYTSDWNPVWSVKTRRNQDGWSAEAAIPFKSLRYQPGRQQVWGFQVQRMKRSTNELSFLAHPPKARLMQAYQHVSVYATVAGLEAPVRAMSIDVKPFVTSNVLTDMTARPAIANDPSADAGLDAKLAITQNLVADLTYNTDFAQVEADEQQVNLTRFGLFFPEKRDVFLENQGTFNFGGIASGGMAAGEAPLLFYSRRIGLNGSRLVPIQGGGRLTGRIGKFSIGAINMQTGDEEVSGAESTNFSVVRVKRDVLRKSSIGAIFTGRSVSQSGIGSSEAYGIDGTFAFFQNLNINTYWARTAAPGVSTGDASYRAQLDYTGDRYGVQLEHLDVGEHFQPQIGFVRRVDLRKERAQFRFSPRPKNPRRIRKFAYQAAMDIYANRDGVLESRELTGEFWIDLQNSDRFRVEATNTSEFLPVPFRIAPGVVLPVGDYGYDNFRIEYQLSQQHTFSGVIGADVGTFYNGRKTTFTLGRGKLNVSSRLSLEPTYAVNCVSLVEGEFTTHLLGSRITFTPTPLMFTSAFLQYNSTNHLVSANVRFRWEYHAGSELFVVFNEERDTLGSRFPLLANRALIVKINRLFRF